MQHTFSGLYVTALAVQT